MRGVAVDDVDSMLRDECRDHRRFVERPPAALRASREPAPEKLERLLRHLDPTGMEIYQQRVRAGKPVWRRRQPLYVEHPEVFRYRKELVQEVECLAPPPGHPLRDRPALLRADRDLTRTGRFQPSYWTRPAPSMNGSMRWLA
jgi:hypothetical protein